MSNSILSAFADEYAESGAEQLEGLKRFGIGHLELRHWNGKNVSLLAAQEVKEIKQQLDAAGIRVSAIGSPLGKIPLDGALNAHFETARRVFEAANLLETQFVRIFSFYAPEGDVVTSRSGEVFDALEKMLLPAQEAGITLCHENEAKIYGDTPERCREIFRHFDGALRCVFDMGNFVLEGVDPRTAYGMLKEHISYFHIKDALAAGVIVPPGKGEACIGEIVSDYRRTAPADFFVSLEPHLQTFSGRNALVGRSFENPYRYEDEKSAFADAVMKFKELF